MAPLRLREIKLIQSTGELILLDIERCFVFRVNKDLQVAMESYMKGSPITVLLKDWLLSEDLLTTGLKQKWIETASCNITDISIDVTGNCNLSCAYCFEKDIDSRKGSMSAGTLETSLNSIFTFPGNRLVIHFGSGEPLMNFHFLKLIVEETLSRGIQTGKEISFELTTNGTLITEEIADFLSKNRFSVRVSIDGPPEIHNKSRPFRSGGPSYAAAVNGFRYLLERMPESTTINTVLYDRSRLKEIWDWACALGTKNLQCIRVGLPSQHPLEYKLLLQEFEQDTLDICQSMINALKIGASTPKYLPVIKTLRRLMIPEPIIRYCGAGKSYLGLSTDGKYYPCFRFIGLNDYELGSCNTSLDFEKIKNAQKTVLQSVDNRLPCKDCWARYLCGGCCYADAVIYGNGHPLYHNCDFFQKEISVALRIYRDLVDYSPEILLRIFGDETLLNELNEKPNFLQQKNCI